MTIDTWIKIWRTGFAVAILGATQFVVCSIIAMVLYPGGTIETKSTSNYSLSQNYLGDLGREVSHREFGEAVAICDANRCVDDGIAGERWSSVGSHCRKILHDPYGARAFSVQCTEQVSTVYGRHPPDAVSKLRRNERNTWKELPIS